MGAGAILESTNGVWDARMQVTLDEIDDILAAWMVDLSPFMSTVDKELGLPN